MRTLRTLTPAPSAGSGRSQAFRFVRTSKRSTPAGAAGAPLAVRLKPRFVLGGTTKDFPLFFLSREALRHLRHLGQKAAPELHEQG